MKAATSPLLGRPAVKCGVVQSPHSGEESMGRDRLASMKIQSPKLEMPPRCRAG
jgi:hypothetical protein